MLDIIDINLSFSYQISKLLFRTQFEYAINPLKQMTSRGLFV